ncbi:MAG TPA: YccF domain-containing protein [Woeseiaceae bacterium]|nr:YccF domain-containing protein [Woeseiaceae bacterium]
MSLLGNLVFFVFGGFLIFIGYVLGGILLCLTIIGIPFGLMCFRLAGSVIAPFGRKVRETEPPGGAISLIMNIIWIILPGLELAIMHLLLAAFFVLTIVGFPIAAQHMKLVKVALLPFGHVMRDVDR